MPNVLRIQSYRFYFYSHEPNEPPHVHIDREKFSAKFWLQPIRLAKNYGFNATELRTLRDLVEEHQQHLLESWNEYFNIEN